MIEMIKNINDHKDNNNISICYNLCLFINDNNIDSEIKLKKIEDDNFNTEEVHERNNIKYMAYITDHTHIEKSDQNIISQLIKIENEYKNTTDEQIKTKCLIMIYDLIDWEFTFPYTAYKLILSDKLNIG